MAASVTQQEQQLKGMDEDMQSFVSTKGHATEELRIALEKLKTMYGSGIRALDDIADELDENSQSTFGHLNSQLFKGIASEAENLLNDLQDILCSQENKLTAYAQHQREAHSRAIETSRKFEECAANEEKQLIEKVAELLAVSNAKKKELGMAQPWE
uniref:Kinesin-like protein KIN-5D n=1 Tax=Tanacetum cinerariifolium TaxID=118510 RepID=A0A699HFS5_TANCI|nr:kinesin-like protein KIN-5D [Tanacetum cinerariifolium]